MQWYLLSAFFFIQDECSCLSCYLFVSRKGSSIFFCFQHVEKVSCWWKFWILLLVFKKFICCSDFKWFLFYIWTQIDRMVFWACQVLEWWRDNVEPYCWSSLLFCMPGMYCMMYSYWPDSNVSVTICWCAENVGLWWFEVRFFA